MLDIIRHMKPPQGRVFIYKYINGMSIKEISDILSVKEKDVRNILYRGKKKLKKLFEQRGDFMNNIDEILENLAINQKKEVPELNYYEKQRVLSSVMDKINPKKRHGAVHSDGRR